MKKAILAAATALIFAAGPGSALAEGDAKKGKKRFSRCAACHGIDAETAKKRTTGPTLEGIFGRKIASVEGYTYTAKLAELGEQGQVWDEANLDKFLLKPKKFAPGTKMQFPGEKKEKHRNNLIAYLKTLAPAK